MRHSSPRTRFQHRTRRHRQKSQGHPSVVIFLISLMVALYLLAPKINARAATEPPVSTKIVQLQAPVATNRSSHPEANQTRVQTADATTKPIQKSPRTRAEAEANFVMDLDWVKRHLHLWFTEAEIRDVSLIVKAEALVCQSDTEWAACVWVILSRVGTPGFAQNHSIHGILSAPNQFSTYTRRNLSAQEDPEIHDIVIDVMARFVLEANGAPPELVGRVMPRTHLFWHANKTYTHNIFYRYCWGDPYDPHDAPYNPYSN